MQHQTSANTLINSDSKKGTQVLWKFDNYESRNLEKVHNFTHHGKSITYNQVKKSIRLVNLENHRSYKFVSSAQERFTKKIQHSKYLTTMGIMNMRGVPLLACEH